VSLVARHLEESGLPTVIIGSGRDIVEQCGVPRFLFVDYPLGNPCGKPYDTEDQRHIVGLALDLLEGAFAPRTTLQAPVVWSEDNAWRDRYMEVTPEKAAELRAAGEARRRKRAANMERFAEQEAAQEQG
jgi:D-proline reductase (dithiol) PrdB